MLKQKAQSWDFEKKEVSNVTFFPVYVKFGVLFLSRESLVTASK